MPQLKIIIFDCDGVLFDSKDANKHYYNYLLDHFGHPPMNEEELNYVHIHQVIDSTRHIFRNYPEDLQKANEYRMSLEYTPFLKHMNMEPDLLEFLTLARKSYKTAISTNRTNTMPAVMEMFGLSPYFDMVVTPLDVENPKPHPEALLKILNQFKLTAGESIYIGDSMVDRDHSLNCNMPMIAFRNRELPAEYHVDTFMEITALPLFNGDFGS
ncbi:HAD family hydrolase [Thermodesulfobacteriota bacterium]